MSREGGTAGRERRDEACSSVAAQLFPPQFYPVVGYQGSPHAWFPPHPNTGVPSQWSPSWRPPMGYPAPTPSWSAPQAASTTVAATPSDEYTVDTLRRVYKDDDGRVEIQRVKVQRRQPETGAVTAQGPESMSVVPVGSILNERRPPPRRNRRKQEIHMTAMGPAGPYPWYPYMPYMPYPYPYPYYFPGCMWPPGAPSDSLSTWSGNVESEAGSSHQDSGLNSQRLESRSSHLSPDSLTLHRSSSPAAASHITDNHSIAPSDSVSVRCRRRETSIERALRGPTPPPRTKSRASSSLGGKSDHTGKTQEWMSEMQRALRTRGDMAVKVTDNGALSSDQAVVYKKIPPIRKRRKMRLDDMSDKSSMADLKDTDDISERQSVATDATFDESSRLSSELNYAFRKLERSVDAFKTEIATETSPLQSRNASPSVDISHSSGDVTPTEARVTPLPLSDIQGLAEKAKEEEAKKHEKYGRPRATSESICSLPSLETRVASAPDISLHSKATVAPQSHPMTSAEASPMTGTPTALYPVQVTPAAETESTEPAEIPKPESVLEAPSKLSTSVETLQTSDANIHAPKTPDIPASQPSPQPHSLQAPPTPPPISSPSETETGIAKVPTEHDIPSTISQMDVTDKANDSVEENTGTATTKLEGGGEDGGRHSPASSATTFFSVRTTDDPHALDTDSTDIPLATTDSATADENEESPGSPGPEDEQIWVLQRPEEAPTLNTTGQDERVSAWRAEVSLWRARLVVSLCRGRGLDRQDWATLHLMVHHPLTMDLKLSLLHAPRLCAANSNVGPAVLRVALIQLAQYGEILLQTEASRQPGWRCIRLDAGQAWNTVKGAAEILHSLGYQERRKGMELRYRRHCGPEASVVARLTLDMLVLAEEFRLYLTGTHQYPNNVSSLFFSESLAANTISDQPQRPPSSEGSFISAQSEVVSTARPQSEASITDEDTETLRMCITETNSHSKLNKNKSSSEEDITLREDDNKTTAEIKESTTENTQNAQQPALEANVKAPPEGQQMFAPDSASINSDVTSLPDLQSMHSRTMTPESQLPSGSEVSSGNETIIPAITPTVSEAESPSKPDEAKPVTTPTAAPDATNDNPEEHVYEEIDVIRTQVQSLRASSEPTETPPPPLPPKKKVSAGGEDDSGQSLTYPHVEWSSASTPASLRGGSTGARRKKRRAPMPPEFLPQNWKENQETPRIENLEASLKKPETKGPDTAKKLEYRRSLNPFYEEIDCVEDDAKEAGNNDATREDTTDNTASGNPFLADKVKATGYVGKNPFYDDVEVLKKSEEYKELQAKHPIQEAPVGELTSTSTTNVTSELSEPPVVRPKRRAPRPPPTPEAQDTHAASHTQDAASPQQGDRVTKDSEGADQANKSPQIEESNTESSTLTSTDSLKNEAKMEGDTKPLNEDTSTVDGKAPISVPPQDNHQDQATDNPRLTPRQSRATRVLPLHPKAPPPPPPITNTEKALREESPPPIPPPKAPLSLLDEIPYMDANEIKEARAQRQSPEPELNVSTSGSPRAVPKLNTLPRQLSLTLVNDSDLPPHCPPPLPPCPPPDSPPETPHTSPPETPHTSPPETPHTSPPETPHASPPPTPRLTPRQSPLPPSRHKLHEALMKSDDEAPPIPPKIAPLETVNGEATTHPPSPPLPPKANRQEKTQNLKPQPSSALHIPVTATQSMQSSTSEERYEIPDTSQAPPPRPPVPLPPRTHQQHQQQQTNGKASTQPVDDRYEVPEAPKHPISGKLKEVVTVKAPEAEERYEIPEVVKEQPLKRGVNGAPCTLGLASSPRRGEMTAIFGPPKPPRRRRNNHSPPPRPPKQPGLIDASRPDDMREVPRASSTSSSSFTSSSSWQQPASAQHKKTPKRRSWPFLLCDCLYVNCRTYDDADK